MFVKRKSALNGNIFELVSFKILFHWLVYGPRSVIGLIWGVGGGEIVII